MLAGGPIISNSQKLKHRAPTGATSHVEYMAICECNRSVIWLRQLLYELHKYDLIGEPTVVYGDNEQANRLCKEDLITSGNKYIRLAYHWNKEVVESGDVVIRSKRTSLMLADLFTKPVNAKTIESLAGKLMGYVSWKDDP